MQVEKKEFYDLEAIEQALCTLNYRLTSRNLRMWLGNESPFPHRNLYNGLGHILNPATLEQLRCATVTTRQRKRVCHSLLGHYLQYRLFPFENELFTWMKGAAAHVHGEKVYFKDIISWCQKQKDLGKRRIMEKETTSLCKFLKPFALSFWEYLLKLLAEECNYGNYAAYCKDKKGIAYEAFIPKLQALLEETAPLYFKAMGAWTERTVGRPLSELTRFDAMYLLGLSEFDDLFPREIPLAEHLHFFDQWKIQVKNLRNLHLHIDYSAKKSAQAMCFPLRIPDEIHLVMNPQGGWIDLEALFHEMGHGLSNAFTSAALPVSEKDFFTSNSLSETYAFLLQNMCFSPLFLERKLGLSPGAIEEIAHFKALKDLAVFRRYASKFLAEYQIFKENDLAKGDAYADLLRRHTGFLYRSDTQIFDLSPEFYALDYVFSWLAEATMEKKLTQTLGDDWMFQDEAGTILRDWWQCGNRYELETFLAVKGIWSINTEDIVERWHRSIQI